MLTVKGKSWLSLVLFFLFVCGFAWSFQAWQEEPAIPVVGEAVITEEVYGDGSASLGKWVLTYYPPEVFTVSADCGRWQMAATQPFTLTFLGYSEEPGTFLFMSEERELKYYNRSCWYQELDDCTEAPETKASVASVPEPLSEEDIGGYYSFDSDLLGGTYRIDSVRKPWEAGWPKIRIRSQDPFKVYERTTKPEVIRAFKIGEVAERLMWCGTALVIVCLVLLTVAVIVHNDYRKRS